jgi:putative membrane protein
MAFPTSNRPTGDTNELAKERNRAAAERTITGWLQNSLTLIGFGLAIDQIVLAVNQQFQQQQSAQTIALARAVGLSFVGMSLVLLVVALLQHRIEIQSVEQDDYVIMPSDALNLLVFGAVLIFAGLAIIGIFLTSE